MISQVIRPIALVAFSTLALFGSAPAVNAADAENSIYPRLAADGFTSDDIALARAAHLCSVTGGRLVLPAGTILLTGSATIVLNHCSMEGVGAPAGDHSGNYGTTILLTSETVSPFQLETGWQVSGINFYWPNQVSGKTPYPPLFSDGGRERGFRHGVIDNIVIVNAYDGMSATPGSASGDVKISNSTMWAYHYLFNLVNTGDSWALTNNRFTPGPLLGKCAFAPECEEAIDEGNHVNAIFHILSGPGVTLVVSNAETFSWRYGILIDEGGELGASHFDVAWDGMGTLIDSSSGGVYAFQNNFTGSMSSCGIVSYSSKTSSGNAPCFHLGSGSGLYIHDFQTDGGRGNWLVGLGGNNIEMNNVDVGAAGRAKDGGEYYMVLLEKPTNTLVVRNSRFGTPTPDDHEHGIHIGTNTMGSTVIQNCIFRSLNGAVTGTTNNRVALTGNTSFFTSPSEVTVDLHGSGIMLYGDNFWDVAPASLLPAFSN